MINFMAQHGRGLICLALTAERCDELGPAADGGAEHRGPVHRLHRDASTPTGASASPPASQRSDRATHHARGHQSLDPAGGPAPARPRLPAARAAGGVLQRVGHTEAAVDLARLAGLYPAGVICEILSDDGTMARRPRARSVRPAAWAHIRHRGPAGRAPAPATRSWSIASPRRACRPSTASFASSAIENDVDRARARRARARRYRGAEGRAGPNALQVPDRRRVRLAALRLRLRSFTRPCSRSWRRAAAWSCICDRKGGASGSSTSSGRTRCRTPAPTPCRRTRRSASRPTCGTTASARRSCATSASRPSGCSPTIPRKLVGLEGYGLEIVGPRSAPRGPTDDNRDYLDAKRDKLGHLLTF